LGLTPMLCRCNSAVTLAVAVAATELERFLPNGRTHLDVHSLRVALPKKTIETVSAHAAGRHILTARRADTSFAATIGQIICQRLTNREIHKIQAQFTPANANLAASFLDSEITANSHAERHSDRSIIVDIPIALVCTLPLRNAIRDEVWFLDGRDK